MNFEILYWRCCRTSLMKVFAKIVHYFWKNFVVDVWQGLALLMYGAQKNTTFPSGHFWCIGEKPYLCSYHLFVLIYLSGKPRNWFLGYTALYHINNWLASLANNQKIFFQRSKRHAGYTILDRPHYLPNNYESYRDILIIVFANDLTPAANKYLYLT